MTEKAIELTRTKRFPDPMNTKRFIQGVLYGNPATEIPTEMHVSFYHTKTDKEPYWTTRYGLHGFDDSFVAYHRRSLFHGLKNNLMRKNTQK